MLYRFSYESNQPKRPEEAFLINQFGSVIRDVVIRTSEDLESAKPVWRFIESLPDYVSKGAASWDALDPNTQIKNPYVDVIDFVQVEVIQ